VICRRLFPWGVKDAENILSTDPAAFGKASMFRLKPFAPTRAFAGGLDLFLGARRSAEWRCSPRCGADPPARTPSSLRLNRLWIRKKKRRFSSPLPRLGTSSSHGLPQISPTDQRACKRDEVQDCSPGKRRRREKKLNPSDTPAKRRLPAWQLGKRISEPHHESQCFCKRGNQIFRI
jgi:hypothetical protein